MSSKSTGRVPKLRLHKPSGRAVVRLDGKDIYLGEYGSEESRVAYDRTIAEWLLLGQQAPASAGSSLGEITIGGLMIAYLEFARGYYRKNGEQTGEFDSIRYSFRPLRLCPEGARQSRLLAAAHSNLTFSPVLEITQDQLIEPTTTLAPGTFSDILRNACAGLVSQVKGSSSRNPFYGPWGFHNTGALIVLYSNTPANTLPLIQHESNTWQPLFPRSARIR